MSPKEAQAILKGEFSSHPNASTASPSFNRNQVLPPQEKIGIKKVRHHEGAQSMIVGRDSACPFTQTSSPSCVLYMLQPLSWGTRQNMEYHTVHQQTPLLKAGRDTREIRRATTVAEMVNLQALQKREKEKKKKREGEKKKTKAPFGVLLATNKSFY